MNLDKIKVIRDPCYALVFDDFFSEETNKLILEEAINNKDFFRIGVINNNEENTKIRSNTTVYYDELYYNDRKKSILLKSIDETLKCRSFQNVLNTSIFPLNMIERTNIHETQVSRYGNNQIYDWHVDGVKPERTITLVYYFNKEPKKFKGGELSLTNSPVHNSVILEKNPKTMDIEAINNRAVVFASTTVHSVKPVIINNDNFEDGRFSVNCWVGIKY